MKAGGRRQTIPPNYSNAAYWNADAFDNDQYSQAKRPAWRAIEREGRWRWTGLGVCLALAVGGAALNLFLNVALYKQIWVLAIAMVVLLVRGSDQSHKLARMVLLAQVRLLEIREAQHLEQEISLDILRKGGAIMDQLDNLEVTIQAVATAEANEEQRIDTLIEALKLPHDDPRVGGMIAELEATRARLAQFHNEQAAP